MSEPTYKTFALDSSGDLDIPIRLLTGRNAFAQRVHGRFQAFLGNWFLDKRTGVPWRELILVRDPNLQIAGSVLRRVVEQTPGCLRVTRFDLQSDSRTRNLSVQFEAIITGDFVFRSQPEEFILVF